MNNNRRDFLKKSASIAALSLTGINGCTPASSENEDQAQLTAEKKEKINIVKDAGMQMSLAYFWGIEPRRVALAKQMDVLGAVGGINPRMAGLSNVQPWEYKAVSGVKEAWEKEGLKLRVIEGPPSLGTKTKLGLEGRDEEIENFISLMGNLSKAGIDVICYNWMPVISWARTTLDRPSRGGALVSAFDIEDIKNESEITEFGELTADLMWKNLEYFLKAAVPEAEKSGIKLALHPDDPPIDNIRGIPRIMTSVDAFKRLIDIYPSSSNGLTFCQGSFASMGEEGKGVDIPAAIEYFGKRNTIHFVHFRDVRGNKNNFEETFHDDGKTDMYRAMQAYYNIGFKGPIRPDHVPTMAEDSNEHPGYSTIGTLFALGYMRGLMEGVSKNNV
jgi:mannonate dehydratase